MDEPLLDASGLSARADGARLDAYALTVAPGARIGLVGPEGAGKRLVIDLLSGFRSAAAGRILFAGEDLAGAPPAAFARAGIARTFRELRLFHSMTAWENVAVALHQRHGRGWIDTMFGLARARRQEAWIEGRALNLLQELGVRDASHLPAASLPPEAARRVAIARALALSPKLLLLDALFARATAMEADSLLATLRALQDVYRFAILLSARERRPIERFCDHIQTLPAETPDASVTDAPKADPGG